MTRKREFDYDQALEQATHLFWKKGYSNTSLRELLAVMGIGEGSFYSIVRSKKELFVRCLAHYNDTVGLRRLSALNSGTTASEGIRAFFKVVLDDLDSPETPRVCLLAGSLAADVLGERDLKKIVVRDMEKFSCCFIARLQRAKDLGEFGRDLDVEATAQILVAYLQGLFRVVRVLHSRSQVEKQIETLLAGLGLQ